MSKFNSLLTSFEAYVFDAAGAVKKIGSIEPERQELNTPNLKQV